MERFQVGIRIDLEFIAQRDAAEKERKARRALKNNLRDVVTRIPGATVGTEMARYWLEETRDRRPDANDKTDAALLAKQGYGNSFIGLALELAPERVREALA
jgi:hypothetical protein